MPKQPSVAFALSRGSCGHRVITGSSVSLTSTSKVQLAVAAVQVTVVVPTGKTLPLAGMHETATLPQLLVAMTGP